MARSSERKLDTRRVRCDGVLRGETSEERLTWVGLPQPGSSTAGGAAPSVEIQNTDYSEEIYSRFFVLGARCDVPASVKDGSTFHRDGVG